MFVVAGRLREYDTKSLHLLVNQLIKNIWTLINVKKIFELIIPLTYMLSSFNSVNLERMKLILDINLSLFLFQKNKWLCQNLFCSFKTLYVPAKIQNLYYLITFL